MMPRHLPYSLVFFAATAAVFALQAIPPVGIFLMFMLAMFWSVLLINAGMIGVAFEAAIGRVSRWWLVLPLAFYAGYWAFAWADHATLRQLSASYAAANARVSTGFDPARQALVFEKEGSGAWLTQNYALAVAYSANSNFPEGYLSHRMMDSGVCGKVRGSLAAQAAFVHAFGFHDGDAIRDRRLEKRFCTLSMPEKPELPVVRVAREETRRRVRSLPVRQTTTTVTMPDGRRFTLLGGVAAPLSWIPMPVIGCALNSGAPSWDCGAGFKRDSFTPIVAGDTRYRRDSVVLAAALGLKRVAIGERRGGDPSLVLKKIETVEESTLARQLAAIDGMIADPRAKADWQVGVVSNRPEALLSRADGIMTGIERAAVAATVSKSGHASANGHTLAGLLARLPRGKFVEFGPRILAVYAQANDKHWLWRAEPLLRRLGDLGPDALPYLLKPQASIGSVNNAGVEGLCRIGAAGRDAAGPVLLARWERLGSKAARDERMVLYVAMRRVGVVSPPIPDDTQGRFAALEADWADISPESPARVCAAHAERQARAQEKRDGVRRKNPE
jgi:hypothetical protein